MEPSYRRARREALVAGIAWLLAGVWVITVCAWLGYGKPVRSIGGIPHWVVWGIFLPWLIFFLHNCWYSLFYLRDDDESSAGGASEKPDPGAG